MGFWSKKRWSPRLRLFLVNVPDDWEHWIEGDDTWQADNRHPNVKGHELAADSAEQWIQTTNLPLDPSKDETNQSVKVKTKAMLIIIGCL